LSTASIIKAYFQVIRVGRKKLTGDGCSESGSWRGFGSEACVEKLRMAEDKRE
jgi:hypothetical protein